MKMPTLTKGKNGKQYTKHEFTMIAAIGICRLPEDTEDRVSLSKAADRKSLFRGIHLLISNRRAVQNQNRPILHISRWFSLLKPS